MSIDVAQPARVRDALLGGSDNFEVDRTAAGELTAGLPGGVETAQLLLRAVGDFRCRVVHHLVAEAGLRQLLQLGTSAPIGRTTHEVAQAIAPDCRVVHCIDDPVALAHAHQLHGSPEGAVGFVHGALPNTARILAEAAATLDLSQPVGLMAPAISVVPDHDDPWSAVKEMLAGMAPGSYFMLVQLGRDIRPDLFGSTGRRHKQLVAEQRMRPLNTRTLADVERFFDGLELLDPGVVRIDEWRPDEAPTLPADVVTPFYGAVGRTPAD